MSRRTIVVLGGGPAGTAAARRAREVDTEARIVLVERAPRLQPDPAALVWMLAGDATLADDDPGRRLADEHGVEVRTGVEAAALAPQRHAVTLRDHGRDEVLAYDALVVALGAEVRSPGFRAHNVRTMRSAADIEAIEEAWFAGARRVAVLGGGPHGVDVASALARAGWDVTIVERRSRLMPGMLPEYAEMAHRALSAAGVHTVLDARTIEAEVDDDRAHRLVVDGDRAVDVDLVVVAYGRDPRTGLLPRGAVAPDGTVRIDLQARSVLPDVYAAGACVSVPRVITGEHKWLPNPALADRVAQVAGANAAGGDARLAPALGSSLVQAGRLVVGRTGLTVAEASLWTPDLRTSTVHAPPHDPTVGAADPLSLTLLWDGRDGRVLGAEAAGVRGADKRLDVVGIAVAAGMPVWTLASLDLAYAPNVATVRDPVSAVATVATQDRLGRARATRSPKAGALVIDVGDADSAVRIPGSIRIPLESLRAQMGELDHRRPVVTSCVDGRRAALAAEVLAQHGFSDVRYMEGGAWSRELTAAALGK